MRTFNAVNINIINHSSRLKRARIQYVFFLSFFDINFIVNVFLVCCKSAPKQRELYIEIPFVTT